MNDWTMDLKDGEYLERTPRGECIVNALGDFRRYRPELLKRRDGTTVLVTQCEEWIEGRWEGFASMREMGQ
jgi:hypothetical protein